MKKILLNIFTLLCSFIAFSQTNYQKGYYIDNQGNKNEGYFKMQNFDEINNKSFKSLDFKKELNLETIKLPIENIAEFGISQDIKYQKMTVQMDDVNLKGDFKDLKEFSLSPSTVFVNVIIEGNASLYSFPGEYDTKYFYKVNDKDNQVTQLLYKRYLNSEGMIVDNAYFRQQVFNNVKCENQAFNEFLNIKYEKNALVPFFENYNKCTNSSYTVYKNKLTNQVKFNFTAFLGAYSTSFQMKDVDPSTGTSSKGMYGIGIEEELLLPSGHWSFYAKQQYGSINTEVHAEGLLSGTSTHLNDTYKLDVKLIDLVLGSRWYYNFEKRGKCFLGAGVGLDFPSGSLVRYRVKSYDNFPTQYPSQENYSLGNNNMYFNFELGYKFNKHFGIDFNIDTNRNFLETTNYPFSTKFNRMGLDFRFTF